MIRREKNNDLHDLEDYIREVRVAREVRPFLSEEIGGWRVPNIHTQDWFSHFLLFLPSSILFLLLVSAATIPGILHLLLLEAGFPIGITVSVIIHEVIQIILVFYWYQFNNMFREMDDERLCGIKLRRRWRVFISVLYFSGC